VKPKAKTQSFNSLAFLIMQKLQNQKKQKKAELQT